MNDKYETELSKEQQELAETILRTDTEDPSQEDLEVLRKTLKEKPGLWKEIADLAALAESKIIRLLASKSALVRESLLQGVREQKKDLGYEEAPALERLLIEQIILCWLHLHHVQQRYTASTSGSYVIEEAEHWEKRLSAAQRRYLRAVKTLARVRKMAGREPLQINIAEKQINVAG